MADRPDFASIRTALGAFFTTVTGLYAMDREGRQSFGGSLNQATPRHAHGLLHLKVIGGIGWDGQQNIYDSGADQGEEITPHYGGLRNLVWEVRVRSQRDTSPYDATSYLERLRTLMHSREAIQMMSPEGLGLQEIAPTVDLTATLGDRRFSIAQMDVRFHAVADVAGDSYGYIDTVDLATDWQNLNGDSLVDEFQFEGEIP